MTVFAGYEKYTEIHKLLAAHHAVLINDSNEMQLKSKKKIKKQHRKYSPKKHNTRDTLKMLPVNGVLLSKLQLVGTKRSIL